jgi:hypothetical protein
MVSDDEEEDPYAHSPLNPNIPQVLIPMTYELWDVVMDCIEGLQGPILIFDHLHKLNFILQWVFGNDRVAMRDAFLQLQENLFDNDEEIPLDDQIWTDELMDNLDDAFTAIDRLNENVHLYKIYNKT